MIHWFMNQQIGLEKKLLCNAQTEPIKMIVITVTFTAQSVGGTPWHLGVVTHFSTVLNIRGVEECGVIANLYGDNSVTIRISVRENRMYASIAH